MNSNSSSTNSGNFTSRHRPKPEPATSEQTFSGSGIDVVEAENDFPMQRIERIRVGSAHAVVRDEAQAEAARAVMQAIAKHVNAAFDHPLAADDIVEIVAK